MNALAPLADKLRTRWRAAMQRLDELPTRERHALLVGALALVVAAELLVVLPMRAMRHSMLAAGAEQSQGEADAAAAAAAELARRTSTLEGLIAGLDRDLAGLGLGRTTGEPLAFLLSRAVAHHGARVLGLRELGVEDIDSAGVTAAHAAAQVAAQPAAPSAALAAAEPASAAAMLYRHRFELSLAGDLAALTAAVRALDQQARPLRVERVRMTSPDGNAVEAAITLSVVGTQRSWLSL